MIVTPYKRPPAPPSVALLTPEGQPVGEQGQLLDLDDWPDNTRLWASYETVYSLVRASRGEALCWNHEEIRWRHRRFEDGWTNRPSDANVIKVPFDHLPPAVTIAALARWRDWLHSYGASPTSTTGSAAWSLLRATITRPLFTGSGERPPLDRTVGGRQQLGPGGPGTYAGDLLHLDIPAAYAATLAGLRYGGQWLQTGTAALWRWTGEDYPVFVRAKVRVPKGLLGPLVARQKRKPRSYLEAMLLGQSYPSGRVVQGVWTWEEVAAAEDAGCRIVNLLDAWVHRSGHYPFEAWWEAIQAGRRMPGLAGVLAKISGNALWGRFCMDVSTGSRTIRSGNGSLTARELRVGGQMFPAHDLAETVSGRVRARLYALMVAAGDSLVSAHTDGAWIKGGDARAAGSVHTDADHRAGVTGASRDGWRLSQHARRLDLLDPQTLRYWPVPATGRGPEVVYAGVPAERAPGMFERAWERRNDA